MPQRTSPTPGFRTNRPPSAKPNRQIRRLVISVHAVDLGVGCAAQVRGLDQPVTPVLARNGWWTDLGD
jgi:hypothetical protein